MQRIRHWMVGESKEYESSSSSWLPHIKDAVGLLSKDDKVLNFGIHRVPARFKSSVNDDALCPRIVSIGHFHRGMPDLLEMHEQKLFYLSFLLHRTNDARTTFDHCCRALSASCHFRNYTRNFGSDSVPADKMMEIMVIDGCFVLELLLRFSYRHMINVQDALLTWFAPSLEHDLLLLQNQIPMFVLEILVCEISRASCLDLTMELVERLTNNFFGMCVDKMIHDPSRSGMVFSRRGLHFLDMMHVAFEPPHDSDKRRVCDLRDRWTVQIGCEQKTPEVRIRCTQELVAAGVKIERAKDRHLLDLSFEDKTLKIPPLWLDLNTWSVLKNLVVLEQCNMERSHHVTSYAVVLRNLIRNPVDVELLEQKGILEGDLAKEYDRVLAFVECIWTKTVITDFTYLGLFDKLNAHHDPWWPWHKRQVSWIRRWDKYKRILRNDYFPNPWRIVQIVVAFLLLALTALQTVYTVISNYDH